MNTYTNTYTNSYKKIRSKRAIELRLAAAKNQYEVVEYMLKHYIFHTKSKSCALTTALKHNNFEIAGLLYKFGASILSEKD